MRARARRDSAENFYRLDAFHRWGLDFHSRVMLFHDRTNNHDVVSALLNGRRYDKEWEKRHGLYARPLGELMRREVQAWAIVQKARRSSAEHLIASKALRCTAWILIVAHAIP